MYKVFFKDRTVYFGDDFSRAFGRNKGLFYRYNNIQELNELVDVFFVLKQIKNLYIFHHDMLALSEEFKSCFHFVEAGGGLVFNGRGEFLVIKRDGIWDLPKGKLEPGEDFETAALREVKEETGLSNLELGQPVISTYHTYQLSDDRILKKTRWFEMFHGGRARPRPRLQEGITEAVWVTPGQTDFIRKNTYPSILDVLYFKQIL
ncbi:MAG TPA: NUDIX domain-containing protein [Bacteroides sp.]|nr:NUDIX domain-containing protein [Bacteroides sp.]